jgi:hypothetical protein
MVIKLASYTLGTVGPSEVCVMRGHDRKLGSIGASIRNDELGSVEGMPLYMLIMVVVVVISIGILVSILGGFQGQSIGTVSADPDVIEIEGGEGTTEFRVIVKDTDGRAIEGATVYVDGEGVATAQKTGEDGLAWFQVTPDLGNKAVGELSIRVSYDGLFSDQTRSTNVLLVRV